MTYGHLFFSIMTLGFMMAAIQLEEKDLTAMHGERYGTYKSMVPMLISLPPKSATGSPAGPDAV